MTLADFLKLHKLTLQGFGKSVGVSHTTVARWVSGKAAPRDQWMFTRIMEVTGGAVTAADFFPGPGMDSQSASQRGLAEAQAPLEPQARALGLDPDAIAAQALRQAIGEAKARRWAAENREALAAWTRHFEETDTPLAAHRAF